MRSALVFVTDFGDAGLVVPVAAAVALALLALGAHRALVVWVAATAGVWGTMLALKLCGYAALDLAGRVGLVTPSGHVASAALAYGGLVALCAGSTRLAVLTALGVALLIGATRVILGDHTLAEAVVGGAVGTAGAWGFAHWLGGGLPARRRPALLAVVAAVVLAFHGTHLTWERQIRAASGYAVRTLSEPL